MEKSFNTDFIHKTVEKKSFKDTPVQVFFTKWCEINDSIVPEFITRDDWQQRKASSGILEKNQQGEKQILFLPDDLHLWEMMDVIKTIDYDTFTRKPEKREQKANEIKELGKTFEKAGFYIFEYSQYLKKGKDIAEKIAKSFYQYGLSLQNGNKSMKDIPENLNLSRDDKTKLDKWFLGEDVYQKRIKRIGEDKTNYKIENFRKNILSLYFGALAKTGFTEDTDKEKSWETKVGPIQKLHNKTREQITKAINTPEREMITTVFRRGVEKLVTEMKEFGWRTSVNNFLKNLGFDSIFEQKKLYDALKIDELKKELETLRLDGNIAKISAKELEIAKKIQKAVSSFPYKSSSNNPSEILQNQFINCVGASMLGGGLLDEVGIKYLVADLPGHSTTVLITSDGKLYLQDFTPSAGFFIYNYKEITQSMVEKTIDLSRVSESGALLQFKKWKPYERVTGKLQMTLFPPEIGLQCQIIYNIGDAFNELGRHKEAVACYKQFAQLWTGPKIFLMQLERMIKELESEL